MKKKTGKNMRLMAGVLAMAMLLVSPFTVQAKEPDPLAAAYLADEAGYYYQYYSRNGESGEEIVNAQGEQVYKVEEGEKVFLCSGGYFLSEKDEVQYLKTAEGEVVFSTEDLGIDGFGMIENSDRNRRFLSDGYVLAYGMEESISGVSFAMGILSTDGEWLVPLSSDMPILSSGTDLESDNFEEDLMYAGDGIILIPISGIMQDEIGYKYDYKFYSVADNACYDLQVVEGEDPRRIWDEYMFSKMDFKDGVSIHTSKKFMFEVHADGTARRFAFLPEDLSLSENLGTFIMDDGKIISLVIDMMGDTFLYDQSGIIKELEGIKPVAAAKLDNGWMITVVNSEGSHYYTAVGLDGEFLFEPVKTEASFLCLSDGRELPFSDNVTQDYGLKQVIDVNGNVLYETQYDATEISVHNGIVLESGKYVVNVGDVAIYTRLEG